MLCDAEGVIIPKPLTYVADNDDLDSLTSVTFLQDMKSSRVPEFDVIDSRKMQKGLLLISKKFVKILEKKLK